MITALTPAGWTGNDVQVRLAAPTVRHTHPAGYYRAHLLGPADSSWRPPFHPVRRRRGEEPEQRRPGPIRHQFGFDRPLYQQYGYWLKDLLTGNLGHTLARGDSV